MNIQVSPDLNLECQDLMLGSHIACKEPFSSCIEQSFNLNRNGTVSPTGAPLTILGFLNGSLTLLSKDEKVNLLIFEHIKSPLKQSEKVFQMRGISDSVRSLSNA